MLAPQLLLLDFVPRHVPVCPGETLGALSVPPAIAGGNEVSHTTAFEEGGIVDVGIKELAEPAHFLEAPADDCCLEEEG